MSDRLKIALGIAALVAMTAVPAIVNSAKADYINGYYRSNGSYTQGHYRGQADGQCWNNKRGC